ncbi:MAG: glycoside hydrolase family 18 protein [Sinobacteraceae bacterium]|nr:glycoside hydrolase family 18 protein [Nevskiaceae bacterium]
MIIAQVRFYLWLSCVLVAGAQFWGRPLYAGEAVVRDATAENFRVVAYVAGWSVPAVIHPQKLTHINFAFARITPDGRVGLADPQLEPALERVVALRRSKPDLKILISVGGWAADGFSDAALTEASREAFAASAVQLFRKYALDGVDLDWEYPGQGIAGITYRAEDRQNFTLLLHALRTSLDAASVQDRRRDDGRRYTLTIASADREYFEHTEMEKLHVYLDWLNVMAYDFFNSLTPTTGHHAGLFRSEFAAGEERDADSSIRQHLAAGIPPGKLVLGVAFYGRGFTGVRPINHGIDQPYARFEGEHSYAQLSRQLLSGAAGFVRNWDDGAKAPYLWNAASRTFITYDDPRSLAIKARYVREHHLGGMMFWELSQDYNDELLDAIVGATHG